MDEIQFDDWTVHGRWGRPPAFGTEPKLAAVIHHAVTDTRGDTAVGQIREIESVIWARRLKAGFSMFAYNHGVPTTADWYHGRGWVNGNGANNNTRGPDGDYPDLENHNTVSIVLAGNYQPDVDGVPTLTPTEDQVATVAHIIATGRDLGHLTPDCLVIPHTALHATSCPGTNAIDRIPDIIDLLDNGEPRMPFTDLPGEAKADYLRGIEKLHLGTGTDPNGKAERDEAVVFAVRAYDAAEALIVKELKKLGAEVDSKASGAAVANLAADVKDRATIKSVVALMEAHEALEARVDAITSQNPPGPSQPPTGPQDLSPGQAVTVQITNAGGVVSID